MITVSKFRTYYNFLSRDEIIVMQPTARDNNIHNIKPNNFGKCLLYCMHDAG